MSRWGKPTKNTKHRDPRYFLNENVELDEAWEARLADDGAVRDAERQTAIMQLAYRLGLKNTPADRKVVMGWVKSGLSPEQIEQRWEAGYRGEFRDLDEAPRAQTASRSQKDADEARFQRAAAIARRNIGLTDRDKLPRPEEDDEMDYMRRLDRSADAEKTPYERFAQQGQGEFDVEPPMGPYTDAGAEEAGGRIERGQDPADGTAGPIKRALETPRYLRALADAALDKNRSASGRQTALYRLSARAEQPGQSGANAKALLDAVKAELRKQKMKSRGGLSEPSPGETAVDRLDESAFDVLAAGRRALKRHLRTK